MLIAGWILPPSGHFPPLAGGLGHFWISCHSLWPWDAELEFNRMGLVWFEISASLAGRKEKGQEASRALLQDKEELAKTGFCINKVSVK